MSAETVGPGAWRPSPFIQFAIQSLLGGDPKHRADIAELVCETLGVRPDFWQTPPAPPPENAPCLVRVPALAGRPRFVVALWEGGRWLALEGNQPVEGVGAWALIPD